MKKIIIPIWVLAFILFAASVSAVARQGTDAGQTGQQSQICQKVFENLSKAFQRVEAQREAVKARQISISQKLGDAQERIRTRLENSTVIRDPNMSRCLSMVSV